MYSLPLNAINKIIQEDAFLNLVISHQIQASNLSDYERRLFTKIVYGTIENKIWIDYQLQPFLKGKRVKPLMKNTLRMGVYMLTNMDLAPHHVVNELVQMVKKRDYKGSQFVNAILRAFLKSPKRPIDHLPKLEYLHLKYSIPQDLLTLLAKQYPNEIEAICALTSQSEVNHYRINSIKAKGNIVTDWLEKDDIEYSLTGKMLSTKVSLVSHPLFVEGMITVQDPSSQRVAEVVAPSPGDRVLDSCSAPGGKAMHMADLMENTGEIIACDIYEHKLNLIHDLAKRLGVEIVKTKLMDAREYPLNESFKHVLVDAPCSGLGVIQHKADLKYRMTLEKIAELVKLQAEILNHVAMLVEPNGHLTYSTCTINKQENEKQVEAFLSKHKEFKKVKEEMILPSTLQDGFYICKLHKAGSDPN